jgi:hypothetical protein
MMPYDSRKLAFYLDGLRYSFAMAAIATKRLRSTLDEVALRHAADQEAEEYVSSALLDAWSVIDMCYRTRELVQRMPALSQKLPFVQAFLRCTGQIEDLRHYVQHFRSGIPDIPRSWTPLWGALTWIPSFEPATCYTIVSGNLIDGVEAPFISYDTHNLRFTGEIVLYAGKDTADIIAVSAHMNTLENSLRDWMKHQPNITLKDANTLIGRISMSPQHSTP